MTTTMTTSTELGGPTAERINALLAQPVLRIDECTEVAPVSRSTVVRAIKTGALAATKVGRNVYVPTPNFLTYIGANPQAAS
jgi:excisionase family DNA binding protein